MTCHVACAVAILGLVLATAALARRRREGFVTPEAQSLYEASRAAFERNPGVTFSDFKLQVAQTDAVQFTDIRKLWLGGQLSPDAVQRVL